jgi:ribulose-phosphate 3-epimerase
MSRQAVLEYLRQRLPLIAPSMLKCDFGNLQREVALLERAGAEVLHLDVMDGHFVPNLTYGSVVIEGLRKLTSVPFDAHLMLSEPGTYIDDFVAAGCQSLTVHIEAVPEPVPLLNRIRELNCVSGIALNPDTPVSAIRSALPESDMVLVMSVPPGFGGQSFRRESLSKVAEIRSRFPDMLIGIDGGIGPETIGEASAAGADLFVVGSSIFGEPDYGTAISSLRALAIAARN